MGISPGGEARRSGHEEAEELDVLSGGNVWGHPCNGVGVAGDFGSDDVGPVVLGTQLTAALQWGISMVRDQHQVAFFEEEWFVPCVVPALHDLGRMDESLVDEAVYPSTSFPPLSHPL